MLIIGLFFKDRLSILLFSSDEYGYFIVLILISTFFSILIIPYLLKLQFEEKQVIFVVLTTISTILSILIRIILIVVYQRGVSGMIEATLISSTFSFLIFFFSSSSNFKFKFNRVIIKKLLLLGLPLIPSFLSLFLLQQGTLFILKEFSTLDIVGLYSIGSNIGSGLLLLVSAFSTAWVPFFLSFIDKKEYAEKLFSKITTYYIFIIGTVSFYSIF